MRWQLRARVLPTASAAPVMAAGTSSILASIATASAAVAARPRANLAATVGMRRVRWHLVGGHR